LPNWVAFRPDAARVYIAETGTNSVTVIDAKDMRALREVKVGQVPQRMVTLRLP
jgi:YVTN family beta-propeller protein